MLKQTKLSSSRRTGSIRTRLLWAFVLVVLLPMIVVASVLAISGSQGEQLRIQDQLDQIGYYKEKAIINWLNSLKLALREAAAAETVRQALQTAAAGQEIPAQDYQAIRAELLLGAQQSGHFEQIFLMDSSGRVRVATQPAYEGVIDINEAFFQQGLTGTTIQALLDSRFGNRAILVSTPVLDASGQPLGVLTGAANLALLDDIMKDKAGLGETGETYLITSDFRLLTDTRNPARQQTVLTTGATNAFATDQKGQYLSATGKGTYRNYQNIPVIGVYRRLSELPAAILAEQETAEVARVTTAILAVSLSMAVASVIIAIVASLTVTRGIAVPVAELAETATQIASGRFELSSAIESNDEIGELADAFNSMSGQLKQTLDGLEQQVAERTFALEERSAYLQASTEVGQAVTTILEPTELIQRIVTLAQERFGLYYVGLFLVDDNREWAVLRAGTGTAGQAMLARGHRLRVGAGMIGWAIANNTPRIALAAAEDAVRLATPELPETRSEAALPLRSRGQVIGALSIQSAVPNAFNKDNIAVFQILADQVAVAFDNARLFAQSQESLENLQRVYREISQQAWSELLKARGEYTIRCDEQGLVEAPGLWYPEMEKARQSDQIVQATDEQATIQSLVVPIKVRGNVIGVLDTRKGAQTDPWTPEQITMLETITAQIGQALESAQLYEGTQLRAESERLAGEITSRMRETLDIDAVLQTAAREFRRALNLAEVEIRLGGGQSPTTEKLPSM